MPISSMLDDGGGRFAVFLRRVITIKSKNNKIIKMAAAMAPPAMAESVVVAIEKSLTRVNLVSFQSVPCSFVTVPVVVVDDSDDAVEPALVWVGVVF